MTEQKHPTLHYKIVVTPKEVHIYAGVFAYGGKMPVELIVPDAFFLSEKLASDWGALDKAHGLRYRICVVKVTDPEELEAAVAIKIEYIKAEWKQLLEQSAHRRDFAKLAIPEWTELV